ncbi:MAG: hypothetical protein HOJ35_03070, partial [Bdellovibrionales bacterium]|nr:hypothetical protein [Bdellovibrionales bacterium]
MYCASSELKIEQKVESVNLTLGLDCTHNGIAGATSLFSLNRAYQLLTLSFNSCNELLYNDSYSCKNPGKGKSFKIMLYGYNISSIENKTLNFYDGNFSNCYNFSDGLYHSNIKIPFGDKSTKLFAGEFKVFDEEDCGGGAINSVHIYDGAYNGFDEDTSGVNVESNKGFYNIFIETGQDKLDVSAPTYISFSGATGAAIGSSETPTLSVNGVENGQVVTIYSDSSCEIGVGSETVDESSVDIVISGATVGNNNFYAKSIDQLGNVSNCSGLLMAYKLDITPPTPGENLSSTSSTSEISLSWSTASDSVTTSNNLEYIVYYSTSNNIDTWSDIGNGTAVETWSPNLTNKKISNLSNGITYFFNVFVRDEANNIASYGTSSNATILNGMSLWLDAQDTSSFVLEGQFNKIGCYIDGTQRAMSYLAAEESVLDINRSQEELLAQCNSLCQDYAYFGLQHNAECWCGNSYDTYGLGTELSTAELEAGQSTADSCTNAGGSCGGINSGDAGFCAEDKSLNNNSF